MNKLQSETETTKTNGDSVQGKFVEIMENYHAGKQKEAMEEACKLMEKFVHSLIKGYRQRNDYEDLFQIGMMAIIKYLPGYDPSKSKPTTYFDSYIRHEIYLYTASNKGSTSYYESLRKKISQQIKVFEENGRMYTTQDLAQICNVPIEAVKNVLATSATTTVEYIPTITEASMTEFTESPEELFIKEERENNIKEIIQNTCSKEDIQLFFAFHGIGCRSMNYKEISRLTGLPFGEIKQRIQRIGKSLRSNIHMAQIANEYTRSEKIKNSEEIRFIDDNEIDELIDEYAVI